MKYEDIPVAEEKELGPLGIGRKPVKDPLKQFNGMVTANGLTMEIITLLLVLPMLRMLYEGSLWTTPNIIFVVALIVIHAAMFAVLRKPWVLTLILAVQVVAGIAGFFVHWSLTSIMVIFGLVWLLAIYLRSVLIERLRRGYLTTQHLGTKE
ncbi:hypothetical protein CPHO_03215 [Corynebacterium phocae]|uniref:DUF4233 domain-containing protein n=1 Tax=Corynebacterium phocae TaxID=161895 RepID=A0A1L7D1P4_9CORY|nr:DUF4233 domain-containing protein [Corynebacterium phocae]APT92065.1 hypothetical protein CPHO_03215 [Corynebacterium phocae]KAA8726448.1 DUF4233 domain-containing protein [Corynebacterium phocae]